MAEAKRGQAKDQRSKAREQRRSLASKPFEAPDEAASNRGAEDSDTIATAKRAARTAAGAALAGGLAGAAKALIDRRDRSNDQDEEQESDRPDGPEQRTQATDSIATEPDSHEDEVATEGDERSSDNPQQQKDERRDDDQPEERDALEGPQRGASTSDVAAMVNRARKQIGDLLGKEPESISGVRHANGSWSVNVEVVEIHRIPDTTDILSSYEVVLDDDGNLVRLDRQRRYRRSQVEEDR